jgi:hypothetical protein
MSRWLVLMIAALAADAGFTAAPAPAAGTAIGNLGDTLRVEYKGIVADVTVHDVLSSEVPPGWGWKVPSIGTSIVPSSQTWCCSTRKQVSTWPSGTSGSRGHRYRSARWRST